MKMPNYKHKIEEPLALEEVQAKIKKAMPSLTIESLSYFWLLYWVGCRKSEGYERKVSDCQLTETSFIIDFGQRKKHGATVPPIRIPRTFPGVNVLTEQLKKAKQKPTSQKRIFYQKETDQPALHKNGTPILKRDGSPQYKKVKTARIERSQWLFPHIQSSWAVVIIKKILGKISNVIY